MQTKRILRSWAGRKINMRDIGVVGCDWCLDEEGYVAIILVGCLRSCLAVCKSKLESTLSGVCRRRGKARQGKRSIVHRHQPSNLTYHNHILPPSDLTSLHLVTYYYNCFLLPYLSIPLPHTPTKAKLPLQQPSLASSPRFASPLPAPVPNFHLLSHHRRFTLQ